MTHIHVTQRLPYPARVVWSLIGDFGGLHRWHPQVCGLDLSWEGRIRTLHYADGGRVVERLEARNDGACRHAYALVDGSLPLQACRSSLEAFAEGDQCVVNWSSEFEVLGGDEMQVGALLRELHASGLSALVAALADG